MKIGLWPRRKLFQTQAGVAADAPDVVRVEQAHLLAVPGRRVVAVAVDAAGRDPVRRAGEHARQPLRAVAGDPDRVLLRLGPLVVADRSSPPTSPIPSGRPR